MSKVMAAKAEKLPGRGKKIWHPGLFRAGECLRVARLAQT
jgi:hypothetical protein